MVQNMFPAAGVSVAKPGGETVLFHKKTQITKLFCESFFHVEHISRACSIAVSGIFQLGKKFISELNMDSQKVPEPPFVQHTWRLLFPTLRNL